MGQVLYKQASLNKCSLFGPDQNRLVLMAGLNKR